MNHIGSDIANVLAAAPVLPTRESNNIAYNIPRYSSDMLTHLYISHMSPIQCFCKPFIHWYTLYAEFLYTICILVYPRSSAVSDFLCTKYTLVYTLQFSAPYVPTRIPGF